MGIAEFAIPRQMWYGSGELRLTFPDSWDVVPCLMNGHYTPPITADQIIEALSRSAGTMPLRRSAAGKREVAIVFDDLSRPTKVADLLPFILEELEAGGVPEEAIRFVCATGSHGAHTYEDFCRKLGEDILDRFPVYNHNPYENCSYIGETSQGTRLAVNTEVMSCDLKIGIGSVVPHVQSGYGGGGKIVLPGIAFIDSIEGFHRLEIKARESGRPGIVGPGNYAENPMIQDFTEAAKLARLDLKIDTVVNGSGQACAIFAGAPEAEFHEALRYAVPHYATKPVLGADVVVVNNYSKGNEAIVGMLLGVAMLMEKGGDMVLVMDCPAGQVVHYLLGSFGRKTGGRLFRPINARLPWVKRLIILSPQYEKSFTDWLAIPDSIWVKSWPEVMDVLMQDFPRGARVAVVPDGTIQYLG